MQRVVALGHMSFDAAGGMSVVLSWQGQGLPLQVDAAGESSYLNIPHSSVLQHILYA